MDGVVAYILGKSYTKKSLIGIGALAGAPCQVQSINKVGKTTTITLKWEDNVGGVHTQAFNVEDGLDGVSVVNATVNANGHLIITLSDGNTIDCGRLLPQYDTMPTPSLTYNGAIFQYIGNTTSNYTKGYFYECINDGGVYKWVNINVQNSEDKFRVTTIPVATQDDVGKIIQYIGVTTPTATNGYFYICEEISTGVYGWVQKNVQPSSGGTGGDGVVDGYYNSTNHLFYEEATYINPISGDSNTLYVSLDTNLLYRYDSGNYIFIRVDEATSGEDDVIDGYYNTTNHKFYEEPTYITEITGQTGKIYISDDTNIQYRWDGTQFITISSSIVVDSALSNTSENPVQNKVITLALNDINLLLASKVDKEAGKGLSTNDFTDALKNKLIALEPIYIIGSGLNLDTTTGELTASGIDVPIDSELSNTSINPVQNKVITLALEQLQGSVLQKIQKKLDATADDFAIFDNTGDIIDSGISKDIVPLTASASNKLLVASDLTVKADKVSGATLDDIALLTSDGNLKDSGKKLSDLQSKLNEGSGIDINTTTNTISLDISYLTASRLGFIPTTEKGANNGVAELDNAGKVPSSQLPSYVDDVIEGYLDSGTFYEDSAHTIPITPESSKIYVNLTDNTTYRWGGTAYVQISSSLALGTTHTTAFYGDYGQTAYAHSQITNGTNPHNTTADNVNLKVPITMLSGSKLQVEETLDALNSEKADKVSNATNGDLVSFDNNGNLTDSGILATDVALNNKAYLIDDTTSNLIRDNDYIPFYDNTNIGKRKSTWNNLKSKLLSYFEVWFAQFDDIYNAIKSTVGWLGKNELPILDNVITTTIEGITYTITRNDNGEVIEIDADGTATSDSELLLYQDIQLRRNSFYFLTGCTGGSTSTYALKFYESITGGGGIDPYSDTRYCTDDYIDIYYYPSYANPNGTETNTTSIIVYSGTTVNHVKFYPMIRDVDIRDNTFEPYHKTVEERLSEKVSYIDNSILGAKNLLPSAKIIGNSVTLSGVTFTLNNDKSISTSGTSSATINFIIVDQSITDKFEYLIGKEVTLSGCPNGGTANTFKLNAWFSDGTNQLSYDDIGNGVTFTFPDITNTYTTWDIKLYVVNTSVDMDDKTFYPMLYLASDTDANYQPYAMTNQQLTEALQWKDA